MAMTKKIITVIAISLTSISYAQTTYYSDRNGQPKGTATTIGNTTYYTNQFGQPMGTASTYGNTTTYANPNGQVIGGVPQPPPPSYPTSNAVGGTSNLPYQAQPYGLR